LVLKGGNNNFGVVTRFDLKTFKNGNSYGYGGATAHPLETKDANLAAFSYLSRKNDPLASFSTGLYYSGGTWVVTNNLYYTKPDTTQWKEYTSITPIYSNTVRLQTVSENAADASVGFSQTRYVALRLMHKKTREKRDERRY
jgi:hypothetical protein